MLCLICIPFDNGGFEAVSVPEFPPSLPTTASANTLNPGIRLLGSSEYPPQSAAEAIAHSLRIRIGLGLFKPNGRLPTERELATTLGASRTTVRAAIRLLADEGLVVTALGRSGGTRVALDNRAYSRKDRHSLAAEMLGATDRFLEFRLTVEPRAASLAAERSERAERLTLQALFTEPVDDVAEYHRVDTRFHVLIAEMSRNELFVSAVSEARSAMSLRSNVVLLQNNLESLYGKKRPQGFLTQAFREEHAAISEAILRGDSGGAAHHMACHLTDTRAQFKSLIDGFLTQ